jgi:hypothetical protein
LSYYLSWYDFDIDERPVTILVWFEYLNHIHSPSFDSLSQDFLCNSWNSDDLANITFLIFPKHSEGNQLTKRMTIVDNDWQSRNRKPDLIGWICLRLMICFVEI